MEHFERQVWLMGKEEIMQPNAPSQHFVSVELYLLFVLTESWQCLKIFPCPLKQALTLPLFLSCLVFHSPSLCPLLTLKHWFVTLYPLAQSVLLVRSSQTDSSVRENANFTQKYHAFSHIWVGLRPFFFLFFLWWNKRQRKISRRFIQDT